MILTHSFWSCWRGFEYKPCKFMLKVVETKFSLCKQVSLTEFSLNSPFITLLYMHLSIFSNFLCELNKKPGVFLPTWNKILSLKILPFGSWFRLNFIHLTIHRLPRYLKFLNNVVVCILLNPISKIQIMK
jgi:hypothetical protein